jgi:hypothetical protein
MPVSCISDSIEPGGVRTEWNKGNMLTLTTHPAYTGQETPSTAFRPMLTMEYTGDPVKSEIFPAVFCDFSLVLTRFTAAKAMVAVSKADNPPMRLPLGLDSLHIVGFCHRQCFKFPTLMLVFIDSLQVFCYPQGC